MKDYPSLFDRFEEKRDYVESIKNEIERILNGRDTSKSQNFQGIINNFGLNELYYKKNQIETDNFLKSCKNTIEKLEPRVYDITVKLISNEDPFTLNIQIRLKIKKFNSEISMQFKFR